MVDKPKTNAEDGVRFLEWKRPGGPWPITAIEPDGRRTPTTWLADAAAVRAYIAKRSGRANLHYTVAEVRSGVERKPSKTDVLASEFLHADLDPPKQLPAAEIDAWIDAEVARVRTLSTVPPPSLIACSGNGLHLLWRLDDTLPISGDKTRWTVVEAHNRWLARELGGDGSTHNCDRLLKLYGSINLPNERKRKVGRVPRETHIIEMNDSRHSLAEFGALEGEAIPANNNGTVAAPAHRGDLRRLTHPDELVEWGMDEGHRLRALILKGRDPINFDGDRSRVVFDLCCNLIRRGVPRELVAGIISDPAWPVSEHVIERGKGDAIGYAWRQVERAELKIAAEGEPFDTDKNGLPYPNQHNVRLALTKMGIRVRYDGFADRATLAGLDGFGPHLCDAAMTRMRLRIDEEHRLKVGKEFFCDIVEDAARRVTFHPVVDYLEQLTWDGTPRLEGWMTTYFDADANDYTRAVGTLMLVAAVRRVRRPGCKFDEMVVLESEQGKAKSSALAILAVKEDWFSDDLPLNAKAQLVIEQTQGRWIIEAGELKGMKAKDIEHLKSFLSRARDTSRMAYGRLTQDVPRHFIVIGTTNDDRYLIDSTGNRRFWPVRVREIDLDALARDRDQLWAEAAAREATGASIRLDRSLWQAAALEQEERRTADPFVAPLADVFRDLQGKVRSRDVWRVIGTPIGQRTPEQEKRLGAAMRELGFEHTKARFGAGPEGCYRRGDEERRVQRIFVQWSSNEGNDDPPGGHGAWAGEEGKGPGVWKAFHESEQAPSRQSGQFIEGNNHPF